MKAIFSTILEDIKRHGNYRTIKYLHPLSATNILYKGREYLNLCSNSYLSLHMHPDVIAAAKQAVDTYGAGICSSRSVSGSIVLYETLEKEIARYKGYQRGLIFPNGYMANIGIISTLTGEKDVIFSDELTHSSLIDAMLFKGEKGYLQHNKWKILSKDTEIQGKRHNMVLTESVSVGR
jgi:7-keto-8-aminopelargonate synthetase-like enzyme